MGAETDVLSSGLGGNRNRTMACSRKHRPRSILWQTTALDDANPQYVVAQGGYLLAQASKRNLNSVGQIGHHRLAVERLRDRGTALRLRSERSQYWTKEEEEDK
jgi:hypothetical protein